MQNPNQSYDENSDWLNFVCIPMQLLFPWKQTWLPHYAIHLYVTIAILNFIY